MPKRFIILFVILGISSSSNAQIDDLPKLPYFNLSFNSRFYKPDSNLVQYEKIKNQHNVFIRRTYYENGSLQSQVTVNRNLRENMHAEYVDDSDDIQIRIEKKYVDQMNGEFIEYFKKKSYNKNNIKFKGHFKNNKPIGAFEFYDFFGDKTIVNFNSNGEVEGEYLEFYFIPETNSYKLKCSGQFEKVKIKNYVYDANTYSKKEEVELLIKRVGTWLSFDINENEIGRTVYQWK